MQEESTSSTRTLITASVLFCFLIYVFYLFTFYGASMTTITTEKPILQISTTRPETIFDKTVHTKLILFYTSLFGIQGLGGWWLTNTTFEDCPYKCGVTTDRSLKHLSDALVFHAEDDIDSPLPLPHSPEKPDQIWVFHLLESPVSSRWINFHKYNGRINWTMTYRRDSDVVWPYGGVLPGPSPDDDGVKLPTLESVKAKTGLVAAMISNCESSSGRQYLIKKLEQYIPVDYYGKCGNLTCGRDRNCYQELSQKYKFWLSFENSLCDDYVTEKFFLPLQHGAVPVVYGGANYSAIAPSNSFINVFDFKTVKDLADHLLRLDRNPSEYLEYFNWMKAFHVAKSMVIPNYCNLCTKLHSITSTSKRKTYMNIQRWFKSNFDGTGESCKTLKKPLGI